MTILVAISLLLGYIETGMNTFFIAIGGAVGALARWGLGLLLNPFFPTLPVGTLTANLTGGFVVGIMMGLLQIFPALPLEVRLCVITGFLGGLTTFSTFSAETVHLLFERNYLYAILSILLHVGGSILMTVLGLIIIKAIFWRKVV